MHKYAPDGRDVTTEDQDIGIARIPGTPVVASELDRSTISNAESPESPQTHVHSHAGSLPVVGVSPPDLGQQGWWDSSSPLSIAVRRRDFLLQNTERRVNANNLAPRAQPNDRRSSSSLRSLDSLEIVNGPATNLKLRDKREDLATKEAPAAERESGVSHSPKTKWNQEKASLEVGENNGPPETPAKFPDSYSSTGCDPFIFPRVSEEDKRLELSTKNLITQRTVFGFIVLAINIGCLVGTLKSQKHLWVLIMILVAKTKDISSTLIQIVWFIFRIFFKRKIKLDASAKWILTCITAYAESEEQIMRTINSILDNAYQPHKIVMVIILDGKPQTILRNFSGVAQTSRRPYQTWRFAHNEANLYAGTIKEIPVIMIEKIGNVGKKDSLILCHDLFNHMRANVPEPTRQLRADIWTKILPKIIPTDLPERFDYLFFADADSVIHAGALSHLAMALTQEPDSIAACGLVLAEMTIDNTWSMWYQYQQFQVSFEGFQFGCRNCS